MPAPARSAPPGDGAFSPELQFLRALWELDHALESASRRMKSTVGVTGRERLIIRIVGERRGITPGALAGVLHVHPSTVTALLKQLRRKHLVAVAQDRRDGRSRRLELTAAGRRVDALRCGTIEATVAVALARAAPEQVDSATRLMVELARGLLARRALPATRMPHRFPPSDRGNHEIRDDWRSVRSSSRSRLRRNRRRS